MDGVIFEIGGFAIKWYSVLILTGVIIGIFMASREAKKFEFPKDFMFNLCFWTIIFGVIGARLYYVAFNLEHFINNPIDILKIWNGGLAIHGGLILGGITAFIYSKKYQANFWRIADILVVPVLLAQAIGRWGNFFNQEAYGPATSLANLNSNFLLPEFVIEGMQINGIYYEPMFYYESLWCLLGVIILLIVRRIKYIKVGQITAIYAMWYSAARFFIEAGRLDALELFGFRVAQIVSIVAFVVGLLAFMILSRKGRFESNYNEKDPTEIRY